MAASYVIDFAVGWSFGEPQAVIHKQKEKSEGEMSWPGIVASY